MPPKFGRRAGEGAPKDAGASGSDLSPKKSGFAFVTRRPADEVVQKDKLRNLDDGVDEQAREEATKRAAKEKEDLVRRVDKAPVGYTATLPKLAELDITNLWNDFLNAIHQDFDMSALTASLSQHLDSEDVTWNPDMLLVQLTSDMLDAAQNGDNAVPAPDPEALAAAGETRRRRKELLENADELQETKGRRPGAGGDEQVAPEAAAAHPPAGGEKGGGERAHRKEYRQNRSREARAGGSPQGGTSSSTTAAAAKKNVAPSGGAKQQQHRPPSEGKARSSASPSRGEQNRTAPRTASMAIKKQ